jgi:hypothetical protein
VDIIIIAIITAVTATKIGGSSEIGAGAAKRPLSFVAARSFVARRGQQDERQVTLRFSSRSSSPAHIGAHQPARSADGQTSHRDHVS